jgi:hypothetical protein
MIINVYNHILPKKCQEIIEKKVTGRNPNLPSAIWSKTVLFRQLSETMGTIRCSLNLRKEVMV